MTQHDALLELGRRWPEVRRHLAAYPELRDGIDETLGQLAVVEADRQESLLKELFERLDAVLPASDPVWEALERSGRRFHRGQNSSPLQATALPLSLTSATSARAEERLAALVGPDLPLSLRQTVDERLHTVDSDWELHGLIEEALEDYRAPLDPAALLPREEARLLATEGAPSHGGVSAGAERATRLNYLAMLLQALTVRETAALLAVELEEVTARLRRGALYGIAPTGRWRVFAFQFVDGVVIPHLAETLAALRARRRHPIVVLGWLDTPKPELRGLQGPLAPLEWLRQGHNAEPVIQLARLATPSS